MYTLSLPNLCATCSRFATLRLPTVDPHSAEVPGGMRPWRVTGGEFSTLYCVVAYIAACVDVSRMVFWDRSLCHSCFYNTEYQLSYSQIL